MTTPQTAASAPFTLPTVPVYKAASVAAKVPPPQLYHYTNRSGFLEILRTNRLWASDLRFLNDAHELAHGFSVVATALERKRPQATGVAAEIVVAALSIIKQLPPQPFFAACFSENGDALGQWRAYSSGGGFALGFPTLGPNTFMRMAHGNGFFFAKVMYDAKEQEDAADLLVAECIERFTAARAKDVTDARRASELNAFLSGIQFLAGAMKDPAFAEEREWRVCSLKVPSLQIRYRTSRSLIVPYVELALDKEAITELQVIVGPCPHAELTKAGAELAIAHQVGQPSRVAISRVPFRDW